ncbi:fimbrial protein [Pseudomonas sp. CCM 7893]|uniref:Fimbrial protein n=2 Tax=Pseudomonas spelaei TaxID=1055469 RepID=A0A6I3WFP7_9PSED|nr:fimbrial protein [Pseudomonas spelaei]
MGDDYQLTEFNKAGSTPRMINFNVGLTKCEQGINSITYSLDATSQVLDRQKGIVALNSSSTAKGIGLQLIGKTGQPLALGTTYTFAGFNSTTNFNIPLSATYYRLAGSTLEAGSANASVRFTVNYL